MPTPPPIESIVLLVPGFPGHEEETDCVPAVQNYVAALARARPDVAVHVIAFQYPEAARTYRWHGATVHALGGRNRRGVGRLRTWIRAALCFARIHQATRPRILHSFWLTECAFVGGWIARRYGLPHVASVAGQDALAANPYLRRFRPGFAVLTAGSPFAARTLHAAAGLEVAAVVPLGLDVEQVPEPVDPPDVDVLGVGSLVPVKDYETFVRVVAALRPAFPDLRACLVGGGPEARRLRALAAALGVSSNLVFAGPVPRATALQYMARSRVLLHPATYEAQAYVLLEALAAGAQVVSRAVGYGGDAPDVHRCTSAEAMQATLHTLLAHPPPRRRVAVPTTDDTVAAFAEVYAGAVAPH